MSITIDQLIDAIDDLQTLKNITKAIGKIQDEAKAKAKTETEDEAKTETETEIIKFGNAPYILVKPGWLLGRDYLIKNSSTPQIGMFDNPFYGKPIEVNKGASDFGIVKRHYIIYTPKLKPGHYKVFYHNGEAVLDTWKADDPDSFYIDASEIL